jgi:TetR/AcrR family transcriptional regulator
MTDRRPTETRRSQITDAALQIVASRGIAALTTRTLAEAVGLTSGALFKHFPSLDAIHEAMAHRVAELLDGTYPNPALAPRERLARLAEARVDLVSRRAEVLTLVMSDQFALAMPDAAVAALRAAVGKTVQFVVTALRDGQADGSVRGDVPAEALAMLFVGAIQATVLAHRTLVSGASAVDALDRLLQPETPRRKS